MIGPLVATAIALSAGSGFAAALLRRRPRGAQRVAAALLCGGALVGTLAAALVLLGLEGSPPGRLRLDALSAIFLLAVLVVAAAGAIYGLGYHPQAREGARSVRLQIFYGLAVGGMALLVAATDAIVFLVGWEVMALANFLLVQTDDERPEVRRAAFLYLAATHAGTLALFGVFALLGRAAGSLDFSAMQGLPAGGAAGIFALALLGFGLKAGLVPLHFWLPEAHAAAPTHVSALMSGVVIKTGIYGLLRVTGLFETPPAWWGIALLVLGGLSAVLGVAFALAQHDLKRLLAYHSVENVGIIALGAGLALLGRSRGEPGLVLLGIAGAALHVLNHALFKSLLFLGAGAVHHATHTRELDHLGGLARAMPRTALLFLVGAAAISGLPPLNGFVSEWLVYLGFLEALGSRGGDLLAFAALGIPVLALVGGLAAACFAKVFGVVFLGAPRSEEALAAHEAPRTLLLPMLALAGGCAAIGLLPFAVVAPLRRAAAAWSRLDPALLEPAAARAGRGAALVALVAVVLLALAAAIAVLRRRRLDAATRAAGAPAAVATWGCGFALPTARMQYTASSFAQLLVRRFSWAIFPRVERPRPGGPFPAEAMFRTAVPDTVLDLLLLPASRGYRWLATRAHLVYLRRMQFQILLVLATLVAALVWGFVL
jgi:formate hydrogenlyase subunit 3/multisubunit Na+/H+ antiporter MnhD subunit